MLGERVRGQAGGGEVGQGAGRPCAPEPQVSDGGGRAGGGCGAPLNRRPPAAAVPLPHPDHSPPGSVPCRPCRIREGPSGMGSLDFRGGPEGLDHRRPSGRAEGPTPPASVPALTRATPGAVRGPRPAGAPGVLLKPAPHWPSSGLCRVRHSPGHHPGCRVGPRAPGIPEGEAPRCRVRPRAPKASVCPPPAPSISRVTGRTWEGDGVRETRRPRHLALHRVWVYVRQAAGAEEHVTWARGPGAPGHSQPPCHWCGLRLLGCGRSRGRRSSQRLNAHALNASRAWGRGDPPSCSPGIIPSSAP